MDRSVVQRVNSGLEERASLLDAKMPRSSIESIYNQADQKSLQLQQDRRLAQLHR